MSVCYGERIADFKKSHFVHYAPLYNLSDVGKFEFLKLDWAPERKTKAERYCEEMIHTGSVLAKKYFTNNHEAFNQTLRRQEVCKLLALFDILDPKR